MGASAFSEGDRREYGTGTAPRIDVTCIDRRDGSTDGFSAGIDASAVRRDGSKLGRNRIDRRRRAPCGGFRQGSTDGFSDGSAHRQFGGGSTDGFSAGIDASAVRRGIDGRDRVWDGIEGIGRIPAKSVSHI